LLSDSRVDSEDPKSANNKMEPSQTTDQYDSDAETVVDSRAGTSAPRTSSQTTLHREPTLDELQKRTGVDRPAINWNDIDKCIAYRKIAFSRSQNKMVMKYYCDSGTIKPHVVIGERSIANLHRQCESKMEKYRNNMILSEALYQFTLRHRNADDFPLRTSDV
jgi:hypothetical protein